MNIIYLRCNKSCFRTCRNKQ